MKNITKELLQKWFGETRLNRPASEIRFGQYAICIDEGALLMKNNANGQIDFIGSGKLGLAGQISKNGRLVLSEIKEKDGESGNVGFFILDEGLDKAVYISITYGKDEVHMRSASYALDFELSSNYDASAIDGSLIVIDRDRGCYRLGMHDGTSLSADIKMKGGAACFMVSKDVGVITDTDSVYVVHGGLRDLIDISKLNGANGTILSEPQIGTGFADEHWLALKDRFWKKQCLLIALNGSERFGFAFCSLTHPFENEDGSEGLRK